MYLSLNEYLKTTYGKKGYKIALKGGMSCPNRDGTCGSDGCIFCDGSGDYAQGGETVTQQIDCAIEKIKHKNKNGMYIAYFQDYTNTYAPVSYLEKLFYEAILHPQVAILSVATRPDCLGENVVTLLSNLNKIKPVWVELGLQTIHDCTAELIGRGYRTEVYDCAVKRLQLCNIKVITHLILGLPGENENMMLQSVAHISEIRTDGVKFHLLHVLKNTKLCEMYRQGIVNTLSFPEYASLLGKCIDHLAPDIVVHRITGDGNKNTLIAPWWSADKKHVLNSLKKFFQKENIRQGKNVLDNGHN